MSAKFVQCNRCGRMVTEDSAHPGYPNVHECIAKGEGPYDEFRFTPYDVSIIAGLVQNEMNSSARFHALYPRDPLRRAGLVQGEAGEAFREALLLTGLNPHPSNRANLRIELIQTAAMCFKALIAMRQEDLLETQ